MLDIPILQNLFNETVILTFISFVIAIMLGIDDSSKNDRNFYVKKFIIMIYSLLIIFLYFSYKNMLLMNINKYLVLLLVIIVFGLIILISSINVAFSFGEEEKKLKIFSLLKYSFFSWFFYLIPICFLLS